MGRWARNALVETQRAVRASDGPVHARSFFRSVCVHLPACAAPSRVGRQPGLSCVRERGRDGERERNTARTRVCALIRSFSAAHQRRRLLSQHTLSLTPPPHPTTTPGGDCAESFGDFSANRIRDTFRVILQMAVVLMFGGGVPVVKIGRMAGQFAKPRTADMETMPDGSELPSYRGDIINGPETTADARIPNPWRLVRAYNQSAATLNLLRGFATGGYAGLQRVMQWNLDFMAKSDEGRLYADLAARVDEAISFMLACGMNYDAAIMRETEFYVR